MNDEIEEDFLEDFPPYEVDELTKDDVLSDLVINYLVSIKNPSERLRQFERVKEKARELKVVTTFNNIYKQKNREIGVDNLISRDIIFPKMDGIVYHTNRYMLDETGSIFEINHSKGKILVCYHPILPVERYKNVEEGTEKIKIAFYKDNIWKYIVVDKSVISSNNSIIKLSDLGVGVNSINAKYLVRYLAEIEYMNSDKIKVTPSVSRLGWIDNDFIPYTSKYEYVGDITYKNVFEALTQKGNCQKWQEEMKKLRSTSITLRFMMATSFASPLVKKLQINPFIVHLWGKSGKGKTVSQMICASIWGNPEKGKIFRTMDNTDVASELLCNFFSNLPVIYDEYQIAKDKNSNYDTSIYKLTEGKGRDRGTKECGLMLTTKWDNIIITSGEEPITSITSKEGVKNRVIEVEDNGIIVDNGVETVNFILNNYGFAGKQFIKAIQDKDDLFEEYKKLRESLKEYSKYPKQINAIACILLADKIASEIIFNDSPIKLEEAKKYFTKDIDEADRCIQLILDFANSNINNFLRI